MKLWRSEPGAISQGVCWCAYHGGYLYVSDTLVGLLWQMLTEWRKDRHIAGM